MANLRDKNDRAVRAFISDTVKGIGGNVPIYISLDPNPRNVTDGPGLIDVQSGTGVESPKGSGNYTFNVRIRAVMPGITQPNQQPNDNHAAIGKLTDDLFNLIHQSNNGQDYALTAMLITQSGNLLTTDLSNGSDPAGVQSAKDNADMGDYSCISLTHDTVAGDKLGEKNEGMNFIELANFSMNVAGYNGYWN